MKKQLFLLLLVSLACSGCSMLRYQYGDRSRIESDVRTGAAGQRTSSSQVEILEPALQPDMKISTSDAPLLTESSQIENPVQSASVPDSAGTAPEPAALPASSAAVKPAASQTSLEDRGVIATSNTMVAKSYSAIPDGSLIYVEKVVCDPPLVYKTDALTSAVETSYARSGRFKMASPESVKSLRSNFEYRSVSENGDWGNLASLARAQKYDYVFYGAIGEQNGKKLLTYYLIKVSTGEIVWENTSQVS
ncbi:MAG: hypothetical protein IJ523_06400 [Succinivibrionaceae bacterium]|nr:hypothetical protein [Succinivibrionaceae bacterium]